MEELLNDIKEILKNEEYAWEPVNDVAPEIIEKLERLIKTKKELVKVYIVESHWLGETQIEQVFDTEDKAKEYVENAPVFIDRYKSSYLYEITEFKIH